MSPLKGRVCFVGACDGESIGQKTGFDWLLFSQSELRVKVCISQKHSQEKGDKNQQKNPLMCQTFWVNLLCDQQADKSADLFWQEASVRKKERMIGV